MRAGAIDKQIGIEVEYHRVKMGYTRQAFAAHCGFTHQQFQKYERGKVCWKVGVVYQVAGALDLDPTDLLPHPDIIPTPVAPNARDARRQQRWAALIDEIPADEETMMLRFMEAMVEGFKMPDAG